MQNFLLIGIILAFFAFRQYHFECIYLLNEYYSCRYLALKSNESLTTNSTWPKEFTPYEGQLSDKFWSDMLATKNSSNASMELFKSIYTESANCTNEVCQCSLRLGDLKKYEAYFLNEDLFDYAKLLFAKFSSRFKQRSVSEIEKSATSELFVSEALKFDSFAPTLVQYCKRFDFSGYLIDYYQESYTCALKIREKRADLMKCVDKHLGGNLQFGENLRKHTNEEFRQFFKCVFSKITCHNDVKNVIKLTFLTKFSYIITGDAKKIIELL